MSGVGSVSSVVAKYSDDITALGAWRVDSESDAMVALFANDHDSFRADQLLRNEIEGVKLLSTYNTHLMSFDAPSVTSDEASRMLKGGQVGISDYPGLAGVHDVKIRQGAEGAKELILLTESSDRAAHLRAMLAPEVQLADTRATIHVV